MIANRYSMNWNRTTDDLSNHCPLYESQSIPSKTYTEENSKKAFILFQEYPAHPSLGVKKMQGHMGIWEGRIDQQNRFTFHYEN